MTHFLFGFHLQKVSKTNPKVEDEQESDINSEPCIMTHFLFGFHLQEVSKTNPNIEDKWKMTLTVNRISRRTFYWVFICRR